MGRIVVTEFVSLDGVMEDPGGAEDFKYGGWSFEFNRGDEGDKFKLDETMGSDALLLGRVTYEGFADGLARARRASSRTSSTRCPSTWSPPRSPTRSGTTRRCSSGDLAEEVAKLKDEHDGDIVVHGSAQLVQALIESDLVDELRLMVFPVVLGTGKRSSATPPTRSR